MSLINKMLQDLEERQPAGERTDAIDASVRPVSMHAGIHPAWRIAAVGALVLALAAAWFAWHRTTARDSEVPHAVQLAQFPLKLDRELSLNLKEVAAPDAGKIAFADPPPDGNSPAAAAMDAAASQSEPAGMREKEQDEPHEKAMVQPRLSPSLNTAAISGTGPGEPAAHFTAEPLQRAAIPSKESAAIPPATRPAETASPIPLAKQVRELSPHDKAENEYRKAAGLIQQARPDEAIATLEQALAFDPRHVGARQALIGLLLDSKRTADALRSAREGLILDSNQAGLAMIAARLQVDNGDLQPAIDTLQRTLPAGAERGDYQAFLAALMQRADRHKEAIAHYMVAVRKAPQNGVWWMGLGISLQAEKRNADALDAFTRAKSSDNLSPELKAFIDQRLGQLQR